MNFAQKIQEGMPGSIKTSTKPVRRSSGKARFHFPQILNSLHTPWGMLLRVHNGSIFLFNCCLLHQKMRRKMLFYTQFDKRIHQKYCCRINKMLNDFSHHFSSYSWLMKMKSNYFYNTFSCNWQLSVLNREIMNVLVCNEFFLKGMNRIGEILEDFTFWAISINSPPSIITVNVQQVVLFL